MGMADDDLAYVVANAQDLSDQQSKFYYASGYSAGSQVASEVMNSALGQLRADTDFLFDLLNHEADLGEQYLLDKNFFTRQLRKINETYDYFGNCLTIGNPNNNGFNYEVVENWAFGKSSLVKKLVEYPKLYSVIYGCSKNVPSPTLEWLALKEFRKEALNEQQQWLADLMKQHHQIKDLGFSFAEKLACPCSYCSACCGKGCECSYTHLDNDEYELGCDDPGECDLYEHSVCSTCQDDCDCC